MDMDTIHETLTDEMKIQLVVKIPEIIVTKKWSTKEKVDFITNIIINHLNKLNLKITYNN